MNEDNSNADLDEFKFNVRKPKDCGKKFNPNTKPDQVKYESMSSMEKNVLHQWDSKPGQISSPTLTYLYFQYKLCVKKNIYNHPSYMSYSNFLQPTRRVRMTTQKILGNILKARKGAHMDKIIFKSKSYVQPTRFAYAQPTHAFHSPDW